MFNSNEFLFFISLIYHFHFIKLSLMLGIGQTLFSFVFRRETIETFDKMYWIRKTLQTVFIWRNIKRGSSHHTKYL